MPRVIEQDYLLISSRRAARLADIVAALNSLHVGVLDIVAPPDGTDLTPRPGHERITGGRVSLQETLGRVTLTMSLTYHLHPVFHGLSPAAFTALLTGIEPLRQPILRDGTVSLAIHSVFHDGDIAWLASFISRILGTTSHTLDAVIFDPAADLCLRDTTLQAMLHGDLIAHVALRSEMDGPETVWLHTHGLQKFGYAELDLAGVPVELAGDGRQLLREIVETILGTWNWQDDALQNGTLIHSGPDVAVMVRPSTRHSPHPATFGRLQLIDPPLPGSRLGTTATDAIIARAVRIAHQTIGQQRYEEGWAMVRRLAEARPDHPLILSEMARYHLSRGEPLAALHFAEQMQALFPERAIVWILGGVALNGLGRYTEALVILTRACGLDPDAAEAWQARSVAYDRLGQSEAAARDRARARMIAG